MHHVERGNAKEGPVEVLYPNSIDVRWHAVPKPKPGQEGVWILHTTTQGDQRAAAPYQLQHPNDYLPVDQLDAIRQAGR